MRHIMSSEPFPFADVPCVCDDVSPSTARNRRKRARKRGAAK
jgi:hypothetical protein